MFSTGKQGKTNMFIYAHQKIRVNSATSAKVYYAAAEILTHATFRDDPPELTDVPREEPCEPSSPIGEAVASAFSNHSVNGWLHYIQERAQLLISCGSLMFHMCICNCHSTFKMICISDYTYIHMYIYI